MTREGLGTTVQITKAIRQQLRSEIKRTGVTAMMLLTDARELPDGLTVAVVNRWLGGVSDFAYLRHLAYVTDMWAALPNVENVLRDGKPVPKRGPRYSDGEKRIEVTAEMSTLLRAELARTGIDHATLLDGIGDAPAGLNKRIIAAWLYRQAKTANEAYWNFVISRLKAQPGSAPLPIQIRKTIS